jgi:hypothetical protein
LTEFFRFLRVLGFLQTEFEMGGEHKVRPYSAFVAADTLRKNLTPQNRTLYATNY